MSQTIKNAKDLLENDPSLSPAVKTVFGLVLLILDVLMKRFKLNSTNSSKPSSTDSEKDKENKKKKKSSNKKPGAQDGHDGTTLKPVSNPDIIIDIPIDIETLPQDTYTKNGFKIAQVFDIAFKKVVTEYRAERVIGAAGKEFTAPLPSGVTQLTQYGASVKEHVVYLATAQFLPYERLKTQFHDQYKMALSCGSIFNFIKEAAKRLDLFKLVAKDQLMRSEFAHADETGIRIKDKLHWLHSVSNTTFTLLEPHAKRGKSAMDDIGILSNFKGILIHDHWAPYLVYTCLHAFCNSHHLRELTWSFEEDKQAWAGEMRTLLEEVNRAVHEAGGVLITQAAEPWIQRYRKIIEKGESECPLLLPPEPIEGGKKKKKRVAQTKSRNLLMRLRDFETETLRFISNILIPFTNNAAEQSLRMEKVKQKISGCYRSLESAKDFALIRSYLLSCQKNDVSASEGFKLLFKGGWPLFIEKAIAEYQIKLIDNLEIKNLETVA